MTKTSILIMEDESSLATAYQKLARTRLGPLTRVHIAQNGVEGLSLFKSHHYDFVVSDLFVPELSGTQFLTSIRDAGDLTPFILISGGFQGRSESEIATHANLITIKKPFSLSVLSEGYRKALGMREAMNKQAASTSASGGGGGSASGSKAGSPRISIFKAG